MFAKYNLEVKKRREIRIDVTNMRTNQKSCYFFVGLRGDLCVDPQISRCHFSQVNP